MKREEEWRMANLGIQNCAASDGAAVRFRFLPPPALGALFVLRPQAWVHCAHPGPHSIAPFGADLRPLEPSNPRTLESWNPPPSSSFIPHPSSFSYALRSPKPSAPGERWRRYYLIRTACRPQKRCALSKRRPMTEDAAKNRINGPPEYFFQTKPFRYAGFLCRFQALPAEQR